MITQDDGRLKKARAGLWRTAFFWTPLFVAAAGAGVYFIFLELTTDDGYGWILPSVLLVFGFLFGVQGFQAIRDLRGGTLTTEGFITRRWWRLDLGSRSHYLRINHEKILRTDRVQYLTVEKDDYVEIEYFPSSMIAVKVDKTEAPESAGPPPDELIKAELPEPDPLLIERD